MKKNTLFHVLSGNVHSHGVSLVTHWGNISGKKKLNWLKCRTADPRSQELGISSVTGSHGGVVTWYHYDKKKYNEMALTAGR